MKGKTFTEMWSCIKQLKTIFKNVNAIKKFYMVLCSHTHEVVYDLKDDINLHL